MARNYAMEIATALAKADSQSLAAIGFELLESLGRAETAAALTEARRAKDRERKRGVPRKSGNSEESAEFQEVSRGSSTTTTTATTQSVSPRARLLGLVPDRQSWEAEIGMMQAGALGGQYHTTESQMNEACSDYLANGAAKNPNIRQFRAYVRRAVQGERPALTIRRGGVGQRSYDNTVEAIKDL